MLTRRARIAVALSVVFGPTAWAGPAETLRAIPPGGAWASEARKVLVTLYDASADDVLAEADEVAAIPCPVWRALDEAVRRDWNGVSFRKVYGFDAGFRYMGGLLGIPDAQADAARTAMAACGLGLPPGAGASTPSASPEAVAATSVRPGLTGVAATLAALPQAPLQVADAAVRALLLSHFDADHDGALHATEATAVGCDVWAVLDDAARATPDGVGLRAAYGVDPDLVWAGGALGLDVDARVPLQLHLSACRIEGDNPAPVAVARSADEVAAAVRALPGGGSDAWDAAVRPLLLDAYDLDRSGLLDAPAELQAIPCIVWTTLNEGVRVSWPVGLRRIYGLAPDLTYVGAALGIDERARADANAAAEACGLVLEPRDTIAGVDLHYGDDARATEVVATLTTVEMVHSMPIVLVAVRDADGDGQVDDAREVDGTSCALLAAMDGRLRATTGAGFIGWLGASPGDVGSADAWAFPGVSGPMRPRLARRAKRCGLV
jgi:hypothetical protein